MPIIAFYIEDLKKLGYAPDKLESALPSMGIEVEEITDKEIKISVTPNRPDLLDFTGFVRALDHFTGKKTPRENFYTLDEEPVLTIDVDPSVKKIRPYIAGIVAENVDLSGNLLRYWINFTNKFADTYGRKRKKLGLGIHNLDRIKGSISYRAAETGKMMPLGAKSDMDFADILKNHEMGAEYGSIYGTAKKTKYPYISDEEKVIVLVPIVQCEQTKATETTKNVFIEITGTSEIAVNSAANMIACSLMYSGTKVHPVTVNYGKNAAVTPLFKEKKMKLSLKRAEYTLGVTLGRHNVVQFANKMGHVAAKVGNFVEFYVPPYRIDVLSERDLIEDIAIAFGYDKIEPLPVTGVADGLAQETTEEENRLAVGMVGTGYTEAINSILTNETINFENMRRKYQDGAYVQIADAKTGLITMVRTDVLPCLLQNLGISTNERMPQRLFEIGRVFSLEGNSIKESVRLALVSEHSKANFAEMRSAVEAILLHANIDEYQIEPFSDPSYIDGRCVKITSKGATVGSFGEIHPAVLEKFGIEEPVIAAEIVIIKEIRYEV